MLEEISQLFESKIRFNAVLGLRVEKIDQLPVSIVFDMKPELIGHHLHGRMHGGVISSVLDVVGGLAVMVGISAHYQTESAEEIMQRFAHLATIDLRVDYLRPGIGDRFFAQANVLRLGRQIAVCRMELLSDTGALVATGNANYIVNPAA